MRNNLEDIRIHRARQFSTRRAAMDFDLTGTLVLSNDGPEVYLLDAGASNKSVYLPALSQEFSILIANVGAANSLDIYNSGGVLQTSLGVGEVKYFFAGPSRWIWLTGNFTSDDPAGFSEELRIVTAAGTQTITASEAGLALNKAVASATPINLPAVATRGGKPVRVIDWAGTVDFNNPVTFTPAGAEKINNAATWEAVNLSSGGIILFPNTALGGWTVGA